MAIAVNGRIAAVTRSFRDGTDIRLTAMVSPEFLRAAVESGELVAVALSGKGASKLEFSR